MVNFVCKIRQNILDKMNFGVVRNVAPRHALLYYILFIEGKHVSIFTLNCCFNKNRICEAIDLS